jgi:hypothetical protein
LDRSAAGTYVISLRYARGDAGPVTITVYLNNQPQGRSVSLDLPGTGGWDTYSEIVLGSIVLEPGDTELSLRLSPARAAGTAELVRFNWLIMERQSSSSPGSNQSQGNTSQRGPSTAPQAPYRLVPGEADRSQAAAVGKEGSPEILSNWRAADIVSWKISSDRSTVGTYTLNLRYARGDVRGDAGPVTMTVYFNNQPGGNALSVELPSTGGWDIYSEIVLGKISTEPGYNSVYIRLSPASRTETGELIRFNWLTMSKL